MTKAEVKACLGEVTSIEKLEVENLSRLGTPFGKDSDLWQKLKAQMQPEDKLYWFCTPLESWEAVEGKAGPALSRDGKIVYYFTHIHC
jgi:hypothetical protein